MNRSCLLHSCRARPWLSESRNVFQGSSSLPVYEPHLRFLVQGHILSFGGDALTDVQDLLDSVVDCFIEAVWEDEIRLLHCDLRVSMMIQSDVQYY